MGWCKKDVTPLLTYWSCVFLTLTHRNVDQYLWWPPKIILFKPWVLTITKAMHYSCLSLCSWSNHLFMAIFSQKTPQSIHIPIQPRDWKSKHGVFLNIIRSKSNLIQNLIGKKYEASQDVKRDSVSLVRFLCMLTQNFDILWLMHPLSLGYHVFRKFHLWMSLTSMKVGQGSALTEIPAYWTHSVWLIRLLEWEKEKSFCLFFFSITTVCD